MVDLSSLSASEIVANIKTGELRSVDVLDFFLERIQTRDISLNAIVHLQAEQARQQAKTADEMVQSGEELGALHGLPMTIKDSFEVAGMPATSGASSLKNHIPQKHADAVQKLVDAGAIIVGKTNLPTFAADFQTYNELHGRTNNPWNPNYTPGGSSGGAAAAVVSGMTPLELGSDIGGSIRIPSHYCGAYGHKSSYGIVSNRGHIPGEPGKLAQVDMAVAGPIARTTKDLKLALEVLVGPPQLESKAISIQLPPPRKKSIEDFRVLCWFDHPLCPVQKSLKQHYQELVFSLKELGVQVDMGIPRLDIEKMYQTYLRLLSSTLGAGSPKGMYRFFKYGKPLLKAANRLAPSAPSLPDQVEGFSMSYREWIACNEQRYQLKHASQRVFQDYDVVLMPVAPWKAFKHDNQSNQIKRVLEIDGQKRFHLEHFFWISWATLCGLPSTCAPVGIGKEGLPYGVQIVGDVYEDLTTLEFASCLEQHIHTFQTPPNF